MKVRIKCVLKTNFLATDIFRGSGKSTKNCFHYEKHLSFLLKSQNFSDTNEIKQHLHVRAGKIVSDRTYVSRTWFIVHQNQTSFGCYRSFHVHDSRARVQFYKSRRFVGYVVDVRVSWVRE